MGGSAKKMCGYPLLSDGRTYTTREGNPFTACSLWEPWTMTPLR